MVIGILSWFDEDPAWLAGTVSSLTKIPVGHLVAVDGAYALYPEGRASSPPEQAAVIAETCRALDIGLTLHAPREVFFGNEVEKRTLGFRLAETVAEPGDWYFVIDADELVDHAFGVEETLARSSEDVASIALDNTQGVRRLYRATPGIHCKTTHYEFFTAGGQSLFRGGYEILRVQIDHRSEKRDRDRRERQKHYYRRRDELGVEKEPECV